MNNCESYKLHGFAVVPPRGCRETLAISKHADELMKNNAPMDNIFYDEGTWELISKIRKRCMHITGKDMVLYGDAVLFVREHGKSHTGFIGPHRDMPDAGAETFKEDGTPGSCVLWFALTEATPENSCLYVLPAEHDSAYRTGGLALEPVVTMANVDKIVALPVKANSIIVLGHRVIHWGSQPFPDQPPRVALSFTLVHEALIRPKIRRTPMCEEERAAIVAAMRIWYFDHAPITAAEFRKCLPVYRRQKEFFNEWFRRAMEIHINPLAACTRRRVQLRNRLVTLVKIKISADVVEVGFLFEEEITNVGEREKGKHENGHPARDEGSERGNAEDTF